MSALRAAVEEYIALRRQLGFKLAHPQRYLHGFVSFLEDRGSPFITTEAALEWAMRPRRAHPSYWAQRLGAVRGFARHHCAADPRTQIPAPDLLRHRPRRARPYLYSEQDIERLMMAAQRLRPAGDLRGFTYATLLGLLVVTGLRISEALALCVEDVDLHEGLLTIRKTKFGKTRLVLLHPSARHALQQYARQRRALVGHETTHFFVSSRGRPLAAGNVSKTFRLLRRRVGLQASERWDTPTLHHFRHRFATESLLRWYRTGDDVERRLPVLSTFLGHVCTSSTYWYLSCHPELMGCAMRRLEQRWEKSS
ncbi:MAG: tyrosine-type recombinase/integrase [Steroidobacteraceae bacterium]